MKTIKTLTLLAIGAIPTGYFIYKKIVPPVPKARKKIALHETEDAISR